MAFLGLLGADFASALYCSPHPKPSGEHQTDNPFYRCWWYNNPGHRSGRSAGAAPVRLLPADILETPELAVAEQWHMTWVNLFFADMY